MLCGLRNLLTVFLWNLMFIMKQLCKCAVHLWKALLVHMVHHDYLIIIAGRGTSRAGGGKTEKHRIQSPKMNLVCVQFSLIKNMSEVCIRFY